MPGNNTIMAQSVYLAQLFAARNTCNCEACRLLRSATEGIRAELMGQIPSGGAKARATSKRKAAPPAESYELEGGAANQ